MANPVKIPAIVSEIKTHGQGVFTLTLAPEKRVPRFKPGQFLHLTIDEYDPQGGFWPESRVFSIASAPTNLNIEIVYSVKGRYTKRMCSEICAGKQVWLKLPYGDFSIETAVRPDQDIVLIAGGTGISPFVSYLQGFSGHVSRRVHLVYGVRQKEHLLYPQMLAECVSRERGFSLDLFIEKGEFPENIPTEKCCRSMITIDHIAGCGKKMKDPAFFLSGPPQMIKNFKNGLLEAGVKAENVKIDEWE